MDYFIKQQKENPPKDALQRTVLERVKMLDGARVDSAETVRAQLTRLVQQLNVLHKNCPPLELVNSVDNESPMITIELTIKLVGKHIDSTLVYWTIHPIQSRLIDGIWYYYDEQRQILTNAVL